MTLRRLLFALAVCMTVLAAWLWVVPGRIGGGATWAVVDGSSMEPRLHDGDFVLLRPASTYEPGMVVGYRSALLHRIVLHRILRVQGGRYVFKGDNNTFLDPEQPPRDRLVGALRVRIPGAGPTVALIRSPYGVGLLLTLVTLILTLPGLREHTAFDAGGEKR